jgi:uncharacterized protein YxeA
MKKWLVIVICIVALLIGAILVFRSKQIEKFFTGDSDAISVANKQGISNTGVQDQMPLVEPLSQTQYKLSYTEALDLYKNSYLQLNENCQLTTRDRNYHLTNEIMVDNRSSQNRIIDVGIQSLELKPFSFGFVILNERGSIPISCDSKNVARITIQ